MVMRKMLGRIQQCVVFSYAFRPFFLLIGAYAVLMILAWGLFLGGVIPWPDAVPARVRHGHEMIFGFAGGAIAGFLLTAVATWTSRPPVAGPTLMLLTASWLLGRAGGISPGAVGGILWGIGSVLFWGGLSGLIAREVIAVGNRRNYKVIPLLLAFLATESVFFLSVPGDVVVQEACLRAGLFLVLGMISLVGGRIIPAFTQNWLRLNRPEIRVQLPGFDRWDLAAVLVMMLFAVGFVLLPAVPLTGWVGLLAGLLHAVRLARWRGWLAWKEPLLWVLHLGYAWIPVGFALLGLAILGKPGLWDAGLHALAYGTVGTLILGVAARVALGHTGRPLRAFPVLTLAFGLISLGTVLRIAGRSGAELLWLAVALWVAAYGSFLLKYTPILLRPRWKDGI